MTVPRAFRLYLFILGCCLLTCCCLAPWLVLNDTASEPRGIYWRTSSPAGIGDYVQLATRYLPVQYPWLPQFPLLKQIRAFGGTPVHVDDKGVIIDGHYVGPRPRNPHVVPYFYDGVVPAGSAWLMGQADASFDSRHFGPIPVSQLSTRIIPLWTF